MSKELPKNNNNSEEVDLIVFFNLIGNAINKVLVFITSVFKALFSVIIRTIKVFINNWKIVLGTILIAAALGFGLEKTNPVTYTSEMLVRPYFDSKFQLVNNINFFNALIANKDEQALDRIFNSDSTPKVDVKSIKGFRIEPGPETENDRILQYQEFTTKLDSMGLLEANYDKFIENRSIYSGSLFLITARSNKKDIFSRLDFGIHSAFTNEFSSSKKIKDSLLYDVQRKNIESSLEEVEKLQDIYIKVLQQQSDIPMQPVKFGELLVSNDNQTDTKEYLLLDKELDLRDQLRRLEEKRITEDVFVDVISNFQPVGNVESSLFEKYSLVFPALAFVILCLFYILKRIVLYAKNYED
ncbi:hypothetical protein [uncultured Lacinutrix sp.]|uniref:hypothetical protein n=1 Tax=uncultured Lacinutrix sp. TaxID=574032 RepID=UPI00261D48FC|nr:hypothetical protein [uncultured Lacinutrix sp.]